MYDRKVSESGDKFAWLFSGPVILSNGSVCQLQKEWPNALTGCVQRQQNLAESKWAGGVMSTPPVFV